MTGLGARLIDMVVLRGAYVSHAHSAIMNGVIQITRFGINHA
jgi:hypothetical protein